MGQYIVRRADTLWEIAGTQLGDSTRWSEVAKLNQLQPPSLIVTGRCSARSVASPSPSTT